LASSSVSASTRNLRTDQHILFIHRDTSSANSLECAHLGDDSPKTPDICSLIVVFSSLAFRRHECRGLSGDDQSSILRRRRSRLTPPPREAYSFPLTSFARPKSPRRTCLWSLVMKTAYRTRSAAASDSPDRTYCSQA
jgi:hypothetical protein